MATTIGMDAAGSRPASIIPNSQVVSAKPKDPSGAGLASFMGSFDHWQSNPDIHCQAVVETRRSCVRWARGNRGGDAPIAEIEIQRDDHHADRFFKTGRRSERCQRRRLARSWKIEPM